MPGPEPSTYSVLAGWLVPTRGGGQFRLSIFWAALLFSPTTTHAVTPSSHSLSHMYTETHATPPLDWTRPRKRLATLVHG